MPQRQQDAVRSRDAESGPPRELGQGYLLGRCCDGVKQVAGASDRLGEAEALLARHRVAKGYSDSAPLLIIRKAFRMAIHAGKTAEYEQRHNPIWPELAETLRAHGVQA
jgi:hypothetical protein